MSSLDWCFCTHIRFWHVLNKDGLMVCLSCGKTDLPDKAPRCDFRDRDETVEPE